MDILPQEKSVCFILLKASENSGHWTCLVRSGTTIYYFDSYGVKPDGELSKIAPNVRYMLHENTKALSRIIGTLPSGFSFQYNNKQFQAYSPNVDTCGKWCFCFSKCIFLGMTLQQFQVKLTELKNEYHCSYDDLACVLWNAL
jgi:hypothetical protein